MDSNFNKGALI